MFETGTRVIINCPEEPSLHGKHAQVINDRPASEKIRVVQTDDGFALMAYTKHLELEPDPLENLVYTEDYDVD